jgi:hypothetical protein
LSASGKSMLTSESFDAYKYRKLLPWQSSHPAITASTFALFARGHYDTVVFEAFRAVEIAVRDASGSPQDLVGVALMRKAFEKKIGPLTDLSLVDENSKQCPICLLVQWDCSRIPLVTGQTL